MHIQEVGCYSFFLSFFDSLPLLLNQVERSVTKKGVSVRFTGLERLTNETALTPLTARKRKGSAADAVQSSPKRS
jgi:hypothetical protein